MGAALSIENESLRVTADASARTLRLTHRASGRDFLIAPLPGGVTNLSRLPSPAHPVFGRGQGLAWDAPDGSGADLMVFGGLPFALLQPRLRHTGAEPRVVRQIEVLSARLEWGAEPSALKSFGTGGLLAVDKNPGSYTWLAVVEPASRRGMVCAWLTQERGSGVLFTPLGDQQVGLQARLDYGRLRLEPDTTEPLETLALGWFDDARFGLEAWAEAVARVHRVRLPPQPTGYCTWYSRPHGGASDEKSLATLVSFAATNLAPFGFSVVQIDDGWQAGVSTNGPRRDFSQARPGGPYPSGMKAAADQIKAHGLVPGLWFMPFAGTSYDPAFRDHQDWFVKRPDGSPYETAWGGTCLDMTHPGARDWLAANARRMARDWGYQYFKMDGLWTGTATRQQYINAGFKDDGMGDAVFHDPRKTNLEACRDGLRLVRQAAGSNVFFLGCCAPQNMRSYAAAIGLVDAMRIGPDNGPAWKSLLRGPTFDSRHYFLHGRVWYNDPDPVYARTDLPLHHARLIASWVAVSGQLNLSSEWLPGLPPERLEILKRTMPAHGRLARPLDLFENDPPRVWVLADTNPPAAAHRLVLGLFNWTDAELPLDLPSDRLGLDAALEHAVFDYWLDAPLPSFTGRLTLRVPAQSCRVLALRPHTGRPCVLSTSRHVTQGMLDLAGEAWDATRSTLRGRSRLVANDPCELRILRSRQPGAARVTLAPEDERAGTRYSLEEKDGLIRLRLLAPRSGEVGWVVSFGT